MSLDFTANDLDYNPNEEDEICDAYSGASDVDIEGMFLRTVRSIPRLSKKEELEIGCNICDARTRFMQEALENEYVRKAIVERLGKICSGTLHWRSLFGTDVKKKELLGMVTAHTKTLQGLMAREQEDAVALNNKNIKSDQKRGIRAARQMRCSHAIKLLEELHIRFPAIESIMNEFENSEDVPKGIESVAEIHDEFVEHVQKMVRGNLPLVISIAKKYRNGNLGFDELVSEGSIGLMNTARMFDISKRCAFSTYAYPAIEQSMKHAMEKKSKNTCSSISEDMSVAHEGGDSERSREERVSHLSRILSDSLDSLDARQQMILRLHYPLDGNRERTIKEIGRLLGITKQRADQIKHRALEKLSLSSFRTELKNFLS